MAPVIGDNSDAMRFVESQIPKIDVPDEPDNAPAPPQQFVVNEEQQYETQPPPAPRPARRPVEDDDTDYDQRGIFKKEGGW